MNMHQTDIIFLTYIPITHWSSMSSFVCVVYMYVSVKEKDGLGDRKRKTSRAAK